jgi:adenosylmethionine-8-amino-7-oxononanoate aminotransferase
MPPLSISHEDLRRLVGITAEAVEAVTGASALPEAA